MTFVIHFSEKLASTEENEVAELLKTLSGAFRSKDVKLLKQAYSAHARITSLRNKKRILDRDEYISQAENSFDTIRDVSFSDVIIRIRGETAVIFCLSSTLFKGNTIHINTRRQFACKKEGGVWKIIEALYV